MQKLKTKPRTWRPRKRQWFDAYVKRLNKLHVAGPFKCTGWSEDGYFVDGVDADGDAWAFRFRDFRLEPKP